MQLLEPLEGAVRRALAEGRAGAPVALRLVVQAAADPGQAERHLALALGAACRFVGAPAERLTATADEHRENSTAILRFAGGQSALVTAGLAHGRRPLVEAVLVGNRGVLSWEPGCGLTPEVPPDEPPLDETAKGLLEATRRSLQERKTVTADGQPVPGEAASPPTSPGIAAAPQLAPTPPSYGLLLVSGSHTHQENYARALAADPRCHLVAVTDEPDVTPRRRALNEQLAAELQIPHIADLAEALARDDVQIVSVCAEPWRRARIIVRCAQAGKHLYLDKPLAASAEQADEIVRAVRDAGVVSHMFSQVRVAASHRLRAAINSGRLGNVIGLHCDMLFAKGYPGTATLGPRTESARPERFELVEAKRELSNVGVYSLVLLRWLLGRRAVRVTAVTGNYFFEEHQRHDMEDFGAALVELEGGLQASLFVGRTGWRSHPMGGLNRAYLVGTEGAVTVDACRPHLAAWSDEEPWQPPRRHDLDPMGFWSSTCAEAGMQPRRDWIVPPADLQDDAAYFLDCVEQGSKSDVCAEVAADATKALMACYQSAAAGATVDVK